MRHTASAAPRTIHGVTPDEMTQVVAGLAVATSRLDDQKHDIDELARAQRRANDELRAAIDAAVDGIGKRIEGFDASCGRKVAELETSVHEDVAELRKEVRGRRWSRTEVAAYVVPTTMTIATLAVTVLAR